MIGLATGWCQAIEGDGPGQRAGGAGNGEPAFRSVNGCGFRPPCHPLLRSYDAAEAAPLQSSRVIVI